MKPLKAGTILTFKIFTWGEDAERFNYLYLKSRRKIRKKGKIKFFYTVEKIEWDILSKSYEHKDIQVSFHSIRSLFQNKKPYEVKKLNENWDVLLTKLYLSPDIKINKRTKDNK